MHESWFEPGLLAYMHVMRGLELLGPRLRDHSDPGSSRSVVC